MKITLAFWRAFCAAAIIALAGFGMAACDNPTAQHGYSGGGGSQGGSGSANVYQTLFELDGNEYRVIGKTGTGTEISIPAFNNGLPVTSIRAGAFYNSNITSVTISESVTRIGDGAFQNSSLASVTIPGSVTHIGSEAFWSTQLTSLNIPNSVTYIGWAAFGFNRLTNITIPNSVIYIRHMAFFNNQLASTTIPDSVIYIGDRAFGNNQLITITVPTHANVHQQAFDPEVTITRRGN